MSDIPSIVLLGSAAVGRECGERGRLNVCHHGGEISETPKLPLKTYLTSSCLQTLVRVACCHAKACQLADCSYLDLNAKQTLLGNSYVFAIQHWLMMALSGNRFHHDQLQSALSNGDVSL